MSRNWVIVQHCDRGISLKWFAEKEDVEKEVASIVSEDLSSGEFFVLTGENLRHCKWSLKATVDSGDNQ